MAFNYKTEYERFRKYYRSLEPKLTKPKSRAYTTVVFSFLTVSLFGWYAIRPTMETIFRLRREIIDKTEVNKKMEEKITALIEAQAVFQQVDPLISEVIQALPDNPEAIPVVVQLRNLADQTGAALTAVQLGSIPLVGTEATPSARVPSPNSVLGLKPALKQAEFPISVVVTGSYPVVRAFLDGVALMRRVANIESLTIQTTKQGSSGTATISAQPQTNVLQLVLRLKTYYLIP